MWRCSCWRWRRASGWPGTRAVATTTFHARHHLDTAHHFGFYTVVWDRLFGTLAPDYERSFARSQVALEGMAAEASGVESCHGQNFRTEETH